MSRLLEGGEGSLCRRIDRYREDKNSETELEGDLFVLLTRQLDLLVHHSLGSTPPTADGLGALRSLTRDLLASSAASNKEPLSGLTYIDNPLVNLARSGMGLLSKLAFGSGPHPADEATIVLCVLGGISFAELYQVQQELESHLEAHPERQSVSKKLQIVLLSTSLICPGDALNNVMKSSQSLKK